MTLSMVQRATVYKLANHGRRYTPAQRRRIRHKEHHARAQRARRAVISALTSAKPR